MTLKRLATPSVDHFVERVTRSFLVSADETSRRISRLTSRAATADSAEVRSLDGGRPLETSDRRPRR